MEHKTSEQNKLANLRAALEIALGYIYTQECLCSKEKCLRCKAIKLIKGVLDE